MKFKPMDPDRVETALAGHKDALTALEEEELKFVGTLRCPECMANSVSRELDAQKPFSDSPLPNFHARCNDCNCLFGPYSGLVIESSRSEFGIRDSLDGETV